MDQVWGVTMVRNEEDVILPVLEHMVSEGVAGLVVANNLSTDRTSDLLKEAQLHCDVPIVIIEDPVEGYYQGAKMTALAHMAALRGATWIVPFDADELWCGTDWPLAEVLRVSSDPILGLVEWTHVETDKDSHLENPFERMAWRRSSPSDLPKIAYRYNKLWKIHQGNDGIIDLDGKLLPYKVLADAVIHHFPARGYDRFEAKVRQGAAAMERTALPESWCSHWRTWGRILEKEGNVREVYREQFFFKDPSDHGLVCDPAPWRRWWY